VTACKILLLGLSRTRPRAQWISQYSPHGKEPSTVFELSCTCSHSTTKFTEHLSTLHKVAMGTGHQICSAITFLNQLQVIRLSYNHHDRLYFTWGSSQVLGILQLSRTSFTRGCISRMVHFSSIYNRPNPAENGQSTRTLKIDKPNISYIYPDTSSTLNFLQAPQTTW
jgi:hypothetical protein